MALVEAEAPTDAFDANTVAKVRERASAARASARGARAIRL